MAGTGPDPTDTEVRDCSSDQLCARPLGCPWAVSGRRSHRTGQPDRGESSEARCYRPPQLPVCRLGLGWTPRSDPLWSDWNIAIERLGPRGLPALRARTNRRASDLSHRGVAAMERSRKTNARITKSRIDLPEYFNSPFAISMYPHIDEFTERGQIVIGYMDPVGSVAIAAEGRNTIAMLRRGKDETFKQLLARLDMAIESATIDDVYVDEVNIPEN